MARRGDGIYLRGQTYSVRMILAIGMSLMLVLTLAPSAWAECAWLMWQQRVAVDGQGNIKQPWEPLRNQYDVIRAFQDQPACERAIAAVGLKAKDVLICLPDTVDPRRRKPERAMKSQAEQDRQALLDQLNGQAHLLDNQDPDLAALLNVKLSELGTWLVEHTQNRPKK
jgi:hypothetical protein